MPLIIPNPPSSPATRSSTFTLPSLILLALLLISLAIFDTARKLALSVQATAHAIFMALQPRRWRQKGMTPSREPHDHRYSGSSSKDSLFDAGSGKIGVPKGLREAAGGGGGRKEEKKGSPGDGPSGGGQPPREARERRVRRRESFVDDHTRRSWGAGAGLRR